MFDDGISGDLMLHDVCSMFNINEKYVHKPFSAHSGADIFYLYILKHFDNE